MKKLVAPPAITPYSQRHKDVVSSKKDKIKGLNNKTKENLINLEPMILARYTLFEQAIAQNSLFDFSEDLSFVIHKDDLLSCYTGRTSKVKEIFNLIEDAQPKRFLKRCPYCGVTLPKTFDHYLPEVSFPELSVHALNLVPCCGTCNQTKNNKWKNATHRTFLHFYSDQIPSEQYLSVTLYSLAGANAVGARFSINKPVVLSNDDWSVLAAHYEKLNLIKIYDELANDEISEIFNACVSHLRCGGVDISKFLTHLLSSEDQLYGLNHWRVVLMKSLSVNNDFTNAVNAAV